MNWFGRDKMGDEAGQWAATAMACMLFVDGAASEAEIAAAKGQVAANPVLHESIGSREAERIFKETSDAIAQIPSAMLPTYELKLQGLAARIRDPNERNFCFTTVIAVAMSDRTLTPSEYQMLQRFREMLKATIPLPEPGAPPTPEVQAVQPVRPTGAAPGCETCGRPTQLYPGRGAWCAACQKFAAGPPGQLAQQAPVSQPFPAPASAPASQPAQWPNAPASHRASQPHQQVAPASMRQSPGQNPGLGACPRCGTALVPYPGYGPYCTPCRQVVR